MAPTPGMVISNNVRLVSPLAEGGMGSVWIADHLGLSTRVAVKFISEDIAKHDVSVERFRREATAAAQIRSAHVVQVFDHGLTEEGMPYIVMELLDGEDVGKRVEREGPMPLAMVTEIIAQACRALHRAHSMGIVHRDIKPDNLFLCEGEGELLVKVLDFGVAKQSKELSKGVTTTGVVVGTPTYMSPEQVLSSKDVDGRSDLWSLGVVAYYCFTGDVPFDGETFGALAVAINSGTYTPLRAKRPDLPPSVEAWLDAALSKDPNHRHPSAKEMANALKRASDPHAPLEPDSTGGFGAQAGSGPGGLSRPQGPRRHEVTTAPALVPSSVTTPSPGAVRLAGDTGGAPAASGPAQQPTFDGAAMPPPGGEARRRWGVRATMVAVAALAAGLAVGAVLYAPGSGVLDGTAGVAAKPDEVPPRPTGAAASPMGESEVDPGPAAPAGASADPSRDPALDPAPGAGGDGPAVAPVGGTPRAGPRSSPPTASAAPSASAEAAAPTAEPPVKPVPRTGGNPAPFPTFEDRGF